MHGVAAGANSCSFLPDNSKYLSMHPFAAPSMRYCHPRTVFEIVGAGNAVLYFFGLPFAFGCLTFGVCTSKSEAVLTFVSSKYFEYNSRFSLTSCSGISQSSWVHPKYVVPLNGLISPKSIVSLSAFHACDR